MIVQEGFRACRVFSRFLKHSGEIILAHFGFIDLAVKLGDFFRLGSKRLAKR